MYGTSRKEIRGSCDETTNNQMELKAAVEALAALKKSCDVELYTDSEYVRKGITEWISKWKLNNWKTASRKPVKNQSLWQQLDDLSSQHNISWFWVKGHAGDPENERADALANQAIDEMIET